MMDWTYFDLVATDDDSDVFYLVDEEGEELEEDGSLVLFVDHEEAEGYLIDNDIRGNVR